MKEQLIAVKPMGALGRIVIPGEIRDAYNLRTGSLVGIYVDGEKVVLKPQRSDKFCVGCGDDDIKSIIFGMALCPDCLNKTKRHIEDIEKEE